MWTKLGSVSALWAALFVASAAARGDVRLPGLFSDHMVLQAGKPAAIWGWADAGETVTVTVAGKTGPVQTVTAEPGAGGKWSAKLPRLEPGGPFTLTVSGRNSLTVNDVLVGEVWLCSGQSNMAMQVQGLHGEVDNVEQVKAEANYPQIRMFAYDSLYSIYELSVPPDEPMAERPGKWVVCSPETVAKFTALGYFFARDIHQQLGVPVGLLNAAIGGTPIEAWTSAGTLRDVPEFQPLLQDWQKRLDGYDPAADQQKAQASKDVWLKQRAEATRKGEPIPKAPPPFKNLGVYKPAGLFNGMIAPLVPFTVRGVLWYQGERNAAGPFTKLYGHQMEVLIQDWRRHWGEELYFSWVQIPRFQKEQKLPSESKGWGVWVREGQRRALKVPRTSMAVTIDYGGSTNADGHPKNKADFARRLSLLALHDVYGHNIPVWCGPIYKSMRRDGDKLVLSFDHATGLKAKDGQLKGFAIAGEDRQFVWADATIEGETVVVRSDQVKDPAAVRYGWSSNPIVSLFNAADIPASPFRTDDWED